MAGLISVQALKPSANQVAGHRFDEGRPGSLVDDSGKFYKPLQGGDRGDKESQFYETLWSDSEVPDSVKYFFAKYFGVLEVPAKEPGSEPSRFLVMEDMTHSYKKPCIADIKIGRRTWYEGATEKMIKKCLEKDATTTSNALGFRIAGMQAYDPNSGLTWKADRDWCKRLTVETVPEALSRFVSINPLEEKPLNLGSIASQVYSGENGVIAHLNKLINWFENQTKYHFYSASILIIYEGEVPVGALDSATHRNVSLRLVDFAHVVDGNGLVDENFLEGIKNVKVYLDNIL